MAPTRTDSGLPLPYAGVLGARRIGQKEIPHLAGCGMKGIRIQQGRLPERGRVCQKRQRVGKQGSRTDSMAALQVHGIPKVMIQHKNIFRFIIKILIIYALFFVLLDGQDWMM